MLNNMVTYGARVGRRFAGSLLAAGAIFGLPAIGQAQGAGSGNNGASPSSSGAVGQNLLANSVAGKLMLKADVGYVYSFSGTWNKSTAEKPSIGGNTSVATGGVGYGVSLGWTHKSGFGIAGDYLGFEHKWTGGGTDVTKPNNQYNYDAIYHVLTVTPNYRFKLDAADRWGLRLGLGVGVSISDITWARKLDTANNAQAKNGTKVAGGAVFYNKNKTDITGTTLGASSANTTITGSNCTYIVNSPALNGGGALRNQKYSDNNGNVFITPNDPNSYQPIPTAPTTIADAKQINCYKSDGSYGGSLLVADGASPVAGGVQLTAIAAPTSVTDSGGGGGAKDDAGVVIAPQIALEYDNSMLHADINVRYIHGLFNVRYFGDEGSADARKTSGGSITYTSHAGPLALFFGAGFGINF